MQTRTQKFDKQSARILSCKKQRKNLSKQFASVYITNKVWQHPCDLQERAQPRILESKQASKLKEHPHTCTRKQNQTRKMQECVQVRKQESKQGYYNNAYKYWSSKESKRFATSQANRGVHTRARMSIQCTSDWHSLHLHSIRIQRIRIRMRWVNPLREIDCNADNNSDRIELTTVQALDKVTSASFVLLFWVCVTTYNRHP